MPQGMFKKGERMKKKTMTKRGDQQKLQKGKRVIKATSARAKADYDANEALTKKITQRIEATMANRAARDTSLKIVKADGEAQRSLSGQKLQGQVKAKKR